MSDSHSNSKRDFLKGAALVGAAAGFAGALAPREAMAQMLETGIREDSALAKIKKEGVMRVGFSQTGPWFYRDAKSGELGGIYKDAVERLAKELEVKVVATAGQVTRGAEPVRAKKAEVWMSGDSDVILFSKRNPWSAVIEPEKPIDKRPNTWAVRYGDPEWKQFLDMWATFLTVNGEMERLFKHHMEKLGAA